MRIKKKNLEAIENLVYSYCKRVGLCKDGERIVVSISSKKSPFKAEANIRIDPEILAKNPWVLWREDNKNNKISCTRIANLLNWLGVFSMYDLVSKKETEVAKHRNMGKKSLKYLKDWMAKYGLYFEMKIPEDVKREFLKLSGMIGDPGDM